MILARTECHQDIRRAAHRQHFIGQLRTGSFGGCSLCIVGIDAVLVNSLFTWPQHGTILHLLLTVILTVITFHFFIIVRFASAHALEGSLCLEPDHHPCSPLFSDLHTVERI
jgi:hypothetical protein